MTKQIITSIAFFVAALLVPASVGATTYQDVECQSVYGGGVVCGVKTHETVDTAVSDYINPSTVGVLFIGASGVFYMISKKAKASAARELIS